MAELKPCPFCGGTKLKVDSKRSNNTRWKDGKRFSSHVVTVRCNRCFARGPATSVLLGSHEYAATRKGEDAAIEAWNRRAEDGK